MVLQEIGGGGYDDVQDTEPTSPSIGDTWLDTSGGDATGKIYADLGNGADWQILPVQDELQSGRTRELLMLLQDKPVPEVQDPMNIQSGSSDTYAEVSSDYEIGFVGGTITSRPDDDVNSTYTGVHGMEITPNEDIPNGFRVNISNDTSEIKDNIELQPAGGGSPIETASGTWEGGDTVEFDSALSSDTSYWLVIDVSDGLIGRKSNTSNFPYTGGKIDFTAGVEDGQNNTNNVFLFNDIRANIGALEGYVTDKFAAPTTAPADFKQWNAIRAEDVTTGGSTSANPVEFSISAGLNVLPEHDDTSGADLKRGVTINPNGAVDSLSALVSPILSGATTAYIYETEDAQDSTANVTEIASTPLNQQVAIFNSIQLEEGEDYFLLVDADGDTYTNSYFNFPSYPYNFDSIDVPFGVYENSSGEFFDDDGRVNAFRGISTETISNRIPKSHIADEPFALRDREYTTTAKSDGQTDYQIATTGDGGHFGIPILTVVSVKKNGSVLDSDNWSFDGDTTVTIDTANVSIASGDTIDIKYDFDVFDSTLQPRAHLSRESTSETSPSISHFRYEYVI